jgi:hypothetical protein
MSLGLRSPRRSVVDPRLSLAVLRRSLLPDATLPGSQGLSRVTKGYPGPVRNGSEMAEAATERSLPECPCRSEQIPCHNCQGVEFHVTSVLITKSPWMRTRQCHGSDLSLRPLPGMLIESAAETHYEPPTAEGKREYQGKNHRITPTHSHDRALPIRRSKSGRHKRAVSTTTPAIRPDAKYST